MSDSDSDSDSTSGDAPRVPFHERLRAIHAETAHKNSTTEGKRFLVIGGTGFVGRYLVEELLTRNAEEVRILCRTPPKEDAGRDRRVTYSTGSVADMSKVADACRDIDTVFHTAAAYGSPNFGRFGKGQGVYDVNVGGVENVVTGCRDQGVPMMLYTSSCNVIFDGTHRENANEETPYADVKKVDHYSRSKIVAEQHVLDANGEGLATAVLRPNGIYGPREDFITKKTLGIARKLRGLPFSLNPAQRTDWTFVYNLVWAHLLGVEALRDRQDEAGGKAYFITDGDALHTMRDFLGGWLGATGLRYRPLIRVPKFLMVYGCLFTEWMCHAMGKVKLNVNPAFTKAEALKAVVTHTHSIERASKLLGYQPLFSTEEGLHYMSEELRDRTEAALALKKALKLERKNGKKPKKGKETE